MAKWEIALACVDEPEAHRKEEGDIIAFKPSPWEWGTIELKEYLIVTVAGMTRDEVFQLCNSLYLNGETDIETIEKKELFPLKKRRFRLPLNILKNGWMSDINLTKVRNKKDAYQPVIDNKIVIDTTEPVSIFLDKLTNKYKFSGKKVA